MSTWKPTAGGATIGQPGPEGGVIDRDESTSEGLRILLESDPARNFYSVTCVIPEWLVHPRFFDARGPADLAYEEMKAPLRELAAQIPFPRPPPGSKETWEAGAKLSAFTTRFP